MKNINKNVGQPSFGYVDINSIPRIKETANTFGKSFASAREVIKKVNPSIPVYLYRPDSVKDASKWFVENFKGFESCVNGAKYNGRVLYSVKSNPDERVILDMFESGVVDFDVASLKETKKINFLLGKKAKLYFMHPVKSVEAISEAYFQYEVKDFSFDSIEELEKIKKATKNAKDLSLHLRIKMDCESSAVNLSGKFGVELEESKDLAVKARQIAQKFGVCFHVGSQCMDLKQYGIAIKRVSEFFIENEIELDSFDIGGGFPASYPNMNTRPMSEYFDQIKNAISLTSLKDGCDIFCEPGRALVAGCESLLVKVEAKKGKFLYINDGTYGGLFDAGVLGFLYFCEVFTSKGKKRDVENLQEFSFYGPTCDSFDHMKGPFLLSSEIEVGDYIEIYGLGAYSKSLRTNFNGYDDIFQFNVQDEIDQKYKQVF